MPCWRATGLRGAMSSSRRRTGMPCGRVISLRWTSRGACASGRLSTNRPRPGRRRWSSCPKCLSARAIMRPRGSWPAPCWTSGWRAARGSTWVAVRACWRSSPRSAAPRTWTPWTSTTGPMRTAARMSPPTASRTVSLRCWATCGASPDGVTTSFWRTSTATSSRPTCRPMPRRSPPEAIW